MGADRDAQPAVHHDRLRIVTLDKSDVEVRIVGQDGIDSDEDSVVCRPQAVGKP
jgi:hypothetical protein